MVKPKKSLGQNFLTNASVADDMAKSLDIKPTDTIVEIGGGRGAVTSYIVRYDYKLLDIFELDQDLINELRHNYETENTHVINENFLDTDLTKYNGDFKVVGSIPYYITSPIIHKILRLPTNLRPATVVLMMQKEVGEKILSEVPDANYWSYTTLGYKVEKVRIVSENDFFPAPKVKSIILKFTRDDEASKLIEKIGFRNWEKFLHHGYKNPRKMINKVFTKELLSEVGIDQSLRPQNLTLENWLKLYEKTRSSANIGGTNL